MTTELTVGRISPPSQNLIISVPPNTLLNSLLSPDSQILLISLPLTISVCLRLLSNVSRPSFGNMRWLRLVRSLKLQVSFAKEPYKRDSILQNRTLILRSLLIKATPYSEAQRLESICRHRDVWCTFSVITAL